jgi:hypothetical protein
MFILNKLTASFGSFVRKVLGDDDLPGVELDCRKEASNGASAVSAALTRSPDLGRLNAAGDRQSPGGLRRLGKHRNPPASAYAWSFTPPLVLLSS